MSKEKTKLTVPVLAEPHTPPRGLEEELTQMRLEAVVLRRHGQERQAEAIEHVVGRIERSAAPFLAWVNEDTAARRSGHSREWFRVRFAVWEADGLARRTRRGREYRVVIVPFSASTDRAKRFAESLGLGGMAA